MSKLPATWRMIPIGGLFEMQLGKMLSEASKGGHSPRPYLANFNVQWRRFDLSEVQSMDFDDDEASKFELRTGDVLVCEGGEVGRSAIWRGEVPGCCYQKALHRLRPLNGDIDRDYFVQFMEWAAAHGWFKRYTVTSSIAHLTRETLIDIEMPVPPPVEQAKIAAVLGAVDEAVERSRAVIAQTRTLRQALLHSLLTRGLPGRDRKAGAWPMRRLGDVTESWQYGMSCPLLDTGAVPIFRMNNYVDARMVANDMKYVNPTAKELAEYRVRRGDILFNRTNSRDLVGKVGVFNLPGDFVFASYLVRFRGAKGGMLGEFVNLLLNTDHYQSRIRALSTPGVSQCNVNVTNLKRLVVPQPPVKEQAVIVAAAAEGTARIAAAQAHLGQLERVKSALSAALLTGTIRVAASAGVAKVQQMKNAKDNAFTHRAGRPGKDS